MHLLPPSRTKRIFLFLVMAVTAIIASWVLFSHPLYSLTIKTANHDYNLRVEFASTPEEQERGLMFRTSLSPDKGMLFVFPKEQILSFWMKNTLIPLDMLFIKPNGRIDFIHHNAQPHDETAVPSPSPALAVLEIGGGQADKHGVKVGDIIKTPLLPDSMK